MISPHAESPCALARDVHLVRPGNATTIATMLRLGARELARGEMLGAMQADKQTQEMRKRMLPVRFVLLGWGKLRVLVIAETEEAISA